MSENPVLPLPIANPPTIPTAPAASAAVAMLIDARHFAALLAVSMATFHRMKAAAKLPKPIALSTGCHRWRLAEVRSWIENDCPSAKEWEARNGSAARRQR